MAQISRSTKIGGGTVLQSNTLARAADVETDVLTLINAHNNADSGTTAWTVVKSEGATSVPLVANNSTGTQNIANFQDNGTNVLTVADGGTTTVTATAGGSTKALIANNSTSTGNIFEAQDNGTAQFKVADGGAATFSAGGTTKLVVDGNGLTLSNSATIGMGSAKITGLAAATAAGDAVRFEQLPLNAGYTPTVTGHGTIANVAMYYSKAGRLMHIFGKYQMGTATGATWSLSIPSGETLDTNFAPNGTPAGDLWEVSAGARIHRAITDISTSTTLIYSCSPTGSAGSLPGKQNGNDYTDASYVLVDLWVAVL